MALSLVMVKLKTSIKMPVHLCTGQKTQVQNNSPLPKMQQQRGSEGMAGTLPGSYDEADVIKLNFWFRKVSHEHGVAYNATGGFKEN